jgi:Possible tRNA binding domain
MIGDILPTLARLLFLGRLKGNTSSTLSNAFQTVISMYLCAISLLIRARYPFCLYITAHDPPPAPHLCLGMRLSYLQVAILLATGLQHRDVDAISAELDLPVNQVLAFFNKVRRH